MDRSRYKAYTDGQILSSSRDRLALELHEKALVGLKKAMAAMEAGKKLSGSPEAEEVCRNLRLLRDSLDMRAGDLARELHRIYDYMLRKLENPGELDSETLEIFVRQFSQLEASWRKNIERRR
jgi:flagellin-specific chaperone FliS